MSTREDDEAISSQIYEEQDLFFDDESLDQPDEGDEEDLPTDQLLASLAAATSSSNGSKYQFSDDDTLRNRLAGPSTNKAGMDCVDKNKVNQIIYEASKVKGAENDISIYEVPKPANTNHFFCGK